LPRYVPKAPLSDHERLAYDERVFGQVNRLLHLAQGQHDRVLALSMASFAEECLGRLLQTFMRDVKAADELIEGFNAPIGTFAARIKLCHALGLITDAQFSDLELVRKIRNEFAHTWDECSFEDQRIKAWVGAINLSPMSGSQDPTVEDKFREAIAGMLIELELIQERIANGYGRLKVIAFHVTPNKPGIPE